MSYIHTKKANADKIQALLTELERLQGFMMDSGRGAYMSAALGPKVESACALGREAQIALDELKDQTGIE